MMDTSPEYVKMCDCPEIQGQKPTIEEDGHHFIKPGMDVYQVGWIGQKRIWLPRQDQLQEMVRPMPKNGERLGLYNLTWLFYQFIDRMDFIIRDKMSFEQLWLAFVMQEKFGKSWDGDKWAFVAP